MQIKNELYTRFVKNLSVEAKQALKHAVVRKLKVSEHVYDNWLKGKTEIPANYRTHINDIARAILCRTINRLIPGIISSEQIIVNLFKINHMNETGRTTIAAERMKRGKMTQSELAKAVHCSPGTISNYERQAYLPSEVAINLPIARRIANYFGLTIDDFVEFK